MQFIKNGPDIPELLLQAHEEGSVVFFCGAGISYPAGLPSFRGLVDRLYDELHTQPNAIEKQAYIKEQYDATLNLLERRIPGKRMAVRTALMKVLQPNLRRKGAIATHVALLQLSRGRDNWVRLVTTNFDRIFQRLTTRSKPPSFKAYPAPLLPIPKNKSWNGVVYLHGLIPEIPDESELNRLVLSSSDFGRAYLTERWAARFVSELFRNYVVCFVGYSINDPVLRYMMDALAADRMLGDISPQAYAFGDFQAGEEAKKKIEWEAKGVTPILYEISLNAADHSLMHQTLQSWAETYRDGVLGKERIVVDYAMARPLASTRQDDFVGRLLWALSHDGGLPAKRFAEFDPVPSLDWLEPLCDKRYCHADLPRFGVQPPQKQNDKMFFSLTHRPTPYTYAPWMMLVGEGTAGRQWDDVMFHLARWLTRHLDDPALVWWLAKQGGQIHDHFAGLLEDRLEKIACLEHDGKLDELDRIRSNAPKAIPRPMMRTLWRLMLTGRLKSGMRNYDFYRWQARFKRDGLTPSLRMELREMFSPRVQLKQPFRRSEETKEVDEPQRATELIDWEIVLSTDYVHSSLSDLAQSPAWQAVLPQMLNEVQYLLRDTLDLMRELGGADDRSDRAHWDLPSISPHWQNRGFRDWVALIEILRDAWLATLTHDSGRARRVVEDWWEQPYPTFKRMALFAATHDGVHANGEWVDWLLADDGWWLWSVETQRETMRLLVLCGTSLTLGACAKLEAGILTGPPRKMFIDDIEPERWAELVDHALWLRLSKLESGGAVLDRDAKTRLEALTSAHPQWQLAKNESDEFSHWMSGTGDPDYEDQRQFERVPRQRRELMTWLKRAPSTHPFHENDWREVCQEKFATAVCALCALAREGQWPAERWREALQAWSDDKLLRRSWRYVATILPFMPEDKLLAIAHSATWWLESAGKVLDRHEAVFFDLCRRFLTINYHDVMDMDRPVARAINHPVGHITQALLNRWFSHQPEDGQGLPADLKDVFTTLCDTNVDQYRHARVLLAANVIAVFRVDCDWATKYLLPLFDWHSSDSEARATWEGFLWSPRLYRPLLAAFKNDFLETALHYSELGEHGRQYAAIFTYAALDPADTFTTEELHLATAILPQEGLQESVQTLIQALEGTGEQREDYWVNRIYPYWQNIWPKSLQLASIVIAEQLARLAIAARGEFPHALAAVRDWLRPVEHPHYVVTLLHKSGLCDRYPQDTLSLLDAIIVDQPWAPRELRECLGAIVNNWPDVNHDPRYQKLFEYERQHCQE